MKNIFLILTTLIFLCSCSSTKSKQQESDKKGKSFDISYINARVILPQDYQTIKLDTLEHYISNNKKNVDIQQTLLSTFNQIRNMTDNYTIFADSKNIENVVWITKGEYVPLNNNLANQYIALLEQQILNSWTTQGIKGTVLEKKILKSQIYFIIKVKFKQDFNGIYKYATQYLVTMNKSTFMFFVSNFDNVDQEEWIKKIKSI